MHRRTRSASRCSGTLFNVFFHKYRDWRRLSDTDTVNNSQRNCGRVSRIAGAFALRDFLGKHGQPVGRKSLDNYMTRALAAGRIGKPIDDVTDPDRLCEVALHSLEKDYDLIGLTERNGP